MIGLQIFHLSLPFKLAKGLKRQVGKQATVFCYHSALETLETSSSMFLYVITSNSFPLLLLLCFLLSGFLTTAFDLSLYDTVVTLLCVPKLAKLGHRDIYNQAAISEMEN